MIKFVTSQSLYRLIVIIAFVLAVLSISWLRSAALSHDEPSASITVVNQPQTFPAWTFKPITSTVPASAPFPLVLEIGEQREVVVEYSTNTVKTYGLATGGTLTPILAIGQAAPGGGTFSDVNGFYAYAASPTLVYITIGVDDSGIFTRHFRWNNGTLAQLPVAAGTQYNVTLNDAHGKFIARRSLGASQFEYWITDGISNSASITLIEDNSGSNPRTMQQLIGITADGGFLVRETITTGSATCSFTAPASPNQPAEASATRLFWLGSRTGTIASGSYTSSGCGGSGNVIHAAVMNSAGDVLSHESTQAVPPSGIGGSIFTRLWLYPGDGSGPSVVGQGEQIGDVGPYFFMQPKAVTRWRQPIFKAATDAQNNTSRLYSGPTPASDAFDGNFTQSFGQDGTPLELYQFSETGGVLVYAQLADNTWSYALGSANPDLIVEWIDPAGGDWNDANNWEPAQVPGQNDETLFKLEATYNITVGTRTAGRSRIENGDVSFRNADLTLIGPLSIGGDAKLTLPQGTVDVGEITIGHLPPTSTLVSPVARLYVSNEGTVITGSTNLAIGAAGAGELFVSDAYLNSSQVRIGVNSPGAAIVGGDNGAWYLRSLAVGSGYTGTLDLEHGADALVDGPAIIGYGATEQNYLATLTLDGAGASSATSLYVSETLTVGQQLRGLLDITNGASAITYQGVDLGAIEHANAQTKPDGEIIVRGEHPIDHVPSRLFIAGDLKLGLDLFNARSHIAIYDGAQINVSGTMTMSVEPGSPSQLLIQGVGTQRSSLTVGAAEQIKACRIGERGEARVFIYEGGWLHCYFVFVGGDSFEGDGIIVVDRRGSVTPSLLQADYTLALGSLPENNGGLGRLILRDGDVEAGTLLLFQNSSIEGSGRVRVTATDGGIVALDGRVDPGITIDAGEPPLEPIVDEPLRLAPQQPAALPPIIQPGTLTISNSVSISPTAVITLDVIGDTSSLYDRLIVTGTAQLGGKLVLNFGNGFAPQQGDSFAFMQAGAFAGSFQTTTIAGLAPGFTYTLSATGGAFNLVALNDGVPTTSALSRVYLPLIRR